jgi:hypothetical protein
MPEEKQIIMFDAPEAASLQTVTGWISAAPLIAAARRTLTIRCMWFCLR